MREFIIVGAFAVLCLIGAKYSDSTWKEQTTKVRACAKSCSFDFRYTAGICKCQRK